MPSPATTCRCAGLNIWGECPHNFFEICAIFAFKFDFYLSLSDFKPAVLALIQMIADNGAGHLENERRHADNMLVPNAESDWRSQRRLSPGAFAERFVHVLLCDT